MFGPDDTILAAEDQGPLDFVLQLPDVARPAIGAHQVHGPHGKLHPPPAHGCAVAFPKTFQEGRKIVATLPQRRHVNHDDLEPVIKVLPEARRFDLPLQVLVGRADETGLDPPGAGLADAAHLAFLKDAEEFGLEGQGQVADFVQEKRAPRGFLDQAGLIAERPGESAADMAEQLAFQEMIGDGRTVDRDERGDGTVSAGVDLPGDQLLARPAFTNDQNGRVQVFDFFDQVQDAGEGFARSDQKAAVRGHRWGPSFAAAGSFRRDTRRDASAKRFSHPVDVPPDR